MECEISDITKAGLLTIKAKEPVIQINQGKRIDKNLLSLQFEKRSTEDIKLV